MSVITKSSVLLCFFFVVKGLIAKNIHKEMFPVYGGKCSSSKAVQPWLHTFRWWRRGWNGGVEVAETKVKRLLCCRFRRIDKVMEQVYQCWWGICREINIFFQVRILHVLRFISIRDLFTDSPSYISLYVCISNEKPGLIPVFNITRRREVHLWCHLEVLTAT
jgi:hypothetical protein